MAEDEAHVVEVFMKKVRTGMPFGLWLFTLISVSLFGAFVVTITILKTVGWRP